MDLIDRQAAIDECYPVTVDGEVYEVVQVETLMGLPCVQPTQTNAPNALKSLDCISRQAALDVLKRLARGQFNLSDEYIHYLAGLLDAEIEIKKLPTAEPDKGHWKKRRHYVSPLHESFVEDYECSNCHFQYGELEWNYCPICGAKMWR